MNSPIPRPLCPPASLPAAGSATQRRVDVLESYAIMDTAPEPEFDQLTHLAANICDSRLAAISLLDGKRQWFKSRVGLLITQTSLEESFCVHALNHPREVMVVPDATADLRFRDLPLVTGETRVRFYAAAPIVTPSGVPIGTLCAFDQRVRTLSQTQHDALQCLAEWVSTFLEKRRLTVEYNHAVKQPAPATLAAVPAATSAQGSDVEEYFMALATRLDHNASPADLTPRPAIV
jgi:GAF domain-containing protein